MNMRIESSENYLARIEELENRVAETEQLIDAIKAGEVDAFAFNRDEASEIYTLQSGDYAYRVLIEGFGEGALNLTEEGLIVYSNTYFYELMGMPYEKVVGSMIFDFVHADSKELFNRLFGYAINGKSKGEINLSVNGRIIPVYISLTSLMPKLQTVGMIITDLTEKKRSESQRQSHEKMLEQKNEELLSINRQLSDSRKFIANVLESTGYGVLSYRAIRENGKVVDFEIRYANDIALEQIQLPAEKVLGNNYRSVYPDAVRHGMFDRLTKVVETGVSQVYEVNPPNNPDRWFMVHYVRLEDGVTATFVEITDQKKQARALQDKNIELEQSNAELASFSYIASHDLQEPLRKIQTFSNRILDKENKSFSDNTRDYFNRIIAASSRMQSLIAALLDYSRTNTSDLNFVSTDLNILLEDAKNHLRELIEDHKAVIISSPLPTLSVVPVQFGQLFFNLLVNAIKYRKDGITPKISIMADVVPGSELSSCVGYTYNNYWKISISDNGIGFDQKYATKIFELFQRLHGRNEYEGTGIGLAICKKIIQNHGGFIKAESQPGVGTTFNLFIPAKKHS